MFVDLLLSNSSGEYRFGALVISVYIVLRFSYLVHPPRISVGHHRAAHGRETQRVNMLLPAISALGNSPANRIIVIPTSEHQVTETPSGH